MTRATPMDRVIADLEGATQTLNVFAHSDELSIDTELGLKWLGLQIDLLIVELREKWNDTLDEQGPKLEAVKE